MMTVRERMAAVLFLCVTWFTIFCAGCKVDDVAVYNVVVRTLWSEETFPKDYPKHRPKAQWSSVFGQSHNNSYALFRIGEQAKISVRNFAQYGQLDDLLTESDDEPQVYDQFSAPPIGDGVGKSKGMVFVDGGHSLVSLISRIIPSPDWFIGVDSLNLCVDSSWIDEVTLDLEPLDAGAASGLTFTSPRWETSPPEPVTKHKPRLPNHPSAGFYYPTKRELPPIATVKFSKIKEYSTIDLNELARQELLEKLEPKKQRHQNNLVPYDDNDNYMYTTKSSLARLIDLEEDPVGTPGPNIPKNNVIVVTQAPKFTTSTTESWKEDSLKNMDDVVLAVAQGRKMGLGKHLPRHFRSRLHHAVNKIQPNDCLVSEWSEWSSCSVTCGLGGKYRYRSVLRQKTDGGRECPTLRDEAQCDDVNSCAYLNDYMN